MAIEDNTACLDDRQPVRRTHLWGIPVALAATVLPVAAAEKPADNDAQLIDLECRVRAQAAKVTAAYLVFHEADDAVDRLRFDRPAALLYREDDVRFELPVPDETHDGTRFYRGKWLAEVALFNGWGETSSHLVDDGVHFGGMRSFGRRAEAGWEARRQEILDAAYSHRARVHVAEEAADTDGKWKAYSRELDRLHELRDEMSAIEAVSLAGVAAKGRAVNSVSTGHVNGMFDAEGLVRSLVADLQRLA